MSRARERLKKILSDDTCTPAAPIFDALSARIAHMLGWELCKLSGSVAKAADLALPDGVPMGNVSDLADICRRVMRVADVSLIVDADDGGGGALNVLRTVQELEAAGVSAIEIEDNWVPRRFEREGSRHSDLVSKEEHVGKLKAAVAARRDRSTVIVARTSALNQLSLDEALDRVKAYAETGADAIMLPGLSPRGLADITAVHNVSNLPICVLGLPPTAVNDDSFLVSNKVRVRFLGQPTYKMAVKAIHDSLAYLQGGGNPEDLRDREASSELLHAVTRTHELKEWERMYAPY